MAGVLLEFWAQAVAQRGGEQAADGGVRRLAQAARRGVRGGIGGGCDLDRSAEERRRWRWPRTTATRCRSRSAPGGKAMTPVELAESLLQTQEAAASGRRSAAM